MLKSFKNYIQKRKCRAALLRVTVFYCLNFPVNAAVSPETAILNEANQLVKENRAKEAYSMLIPYESSRAGDPAFDYMLGVSALESGDLSNAVFALQRAVAMKPDFVGAKVDLARSYYKLGELGEASKEFRSIYQYKPSTRLRGVVDLYLNDIKRKQQGNQRRNSTSLALDLGMGYDTNANSAPGLDSYLGISLDENSQQKPSSYFDTSARINHALVLDKHNTFALNASVSRRENSNASFVNNMSFSLGGSYLRKLNKSQLSLTTQYYQAYVAGNFSGSNIAAISQYTFPVDAGQKVSVMANLSMFRGDSASSVRDINQLLLGGNWQFDLKNTVLPKMQVSITSGRASALTENSPYGKRISSMRLLFSKAIKMRFPWLFRTSLNYTTTEYEGLFNGLERVESTNTFDIASDLLISKNLKLIFSGKHNINRSSIDIYTYTRNEVKTGLQWVIR